MRTSQPTSTNSTGAHGLGAGLGMGAAQRLPVAPRERKPALAALAVLLILGGALVSAYLVMDSGDRVSAIAIAKPVAAGERIPLDALKEVQIGDTGIAYEPWSNRAQVAQYYAAVPLLPDQIFIRSMATQVDDAMKGRVIVGLSLKPNQLPASGVRRQQKVALYAVGSRADTVKPGTLLAPDAIVIDVVGAGTGTTRSVSSSAETRVSVLVTPEQAPFVAQAASAGGVAAVGVPPGTVVTPPTAAARPKPTTGG